MQKKKEIKTNAKRKKKKTVLYKKNAKGKNEK